MAHTLATLGSSQADNHFTQPDTTYPDRHVNVHLVSLAIMHRALSMTPSSHLAPGQDRTTTAPTLATWQALTSIRASAQHGVMSLARDPSFIPNLASHALSSKYCRSSFSTSCIQPRGRPSHVWHGKALGIAVPQTLRSAVHVFIGQEDIP